LAEPIEFYKMSGAGNDFILGDNRSGRWPSNDLPGLAARLCRRRLGIGADGLLLLENSPRASFKVDIYNSDGSRARMCGNGARCAARFAFLKVIAGKHMTMEFPAGVLEAEILSGDDVQVTMPLRLEPPVPASLDIRGKEIKGFRVHAGVPHFILFVREMEAAPVSTLGPLIRSHPFFGEAGTNVDFLSLRESGPTAIRTWERGVEGETLACGTGVTAAAWLLQERYGKRGPHRLLVRSGSVLEVGLPGAGNGSREVFLKGEARVVYRGILSGGSIHSEREGGSP
jgi:diaminopimelate epimerase